MDTSWLRLGTVGALGLTAPLWWTWAVGQMIYAAYILAGSPRRPSASFLVISQVVPSALIGAAAGAIVALLAPRSPMKAWLLFIGALLCGMAAYGVIADEGPEFVAVLVQTSGNIAFLVTTITAPLILHFRNRGG